MAHFARLRGTQVVQVIVVPDSDAPDEQSGIQFLEKLYGPNLVWKQTSYNTYGGVHRDGGTPFRKNYAGIGYSYDEERDAFIPPRPHASWVLDEATCFWVSPIPCPQDGKQYVWNENRREWEELIVW